MIVFSVDLHPEDGYLKNEHINRACIRRNKTLFGKKYKIFTPEDELVKEALSFYGEKILNNRPAENYRNDLIRVYLLWKLEEAWYIDADVFIQKADLKKIKKNIYGCLNCSHAFFSATNGGCQEGREYWGNVCKEIKKDLEDNGDSEDKFDGYYYNKLNLKTIYIQEVKFFHYEKWIMVCDANKKKKKYIYLKESYLMHNININEDRKDLRFVLLNPNYEISYNFPVIPMFKEIWGTKEEAEKYFAETYKLYVKS